MEHWFDRLSQPQTRRTMLKAAAVGAGAALFAPVFRPQLAWATEGDPCFIPCVNAGTVKWNAAKQACGATAQRVAGAGFVFLMTGNVGPAALLGLAANAGLTSCLSSGELTWHRDTLDCRGAECGNGTKYPGGTVPPPPNPQVPCTDPAKPIPCGKECCYSVNHCCPDAATDGGYKCWSVNHVCGS